MCYLINPQATTQAHDAKSVFFFFLLFFVVVVVYFLSNVQRNVTYSKHGESHVSRIPGKLSCCVIEYVTFR